MSRISHTLVPTDRVSPDFPSCQSCQEGCSCQQDDLVFLVSAVAAVAFARI